jgi:hypothetical protein
MEKLFVLFIAAVLFGVIVAALVIFPLLQIWGFKILRRRR